MLKFGVTRAEQLRPGSLTRFSRRISYQLLRTSVPATPAEVALFETVMRHLQLASGVYRTTFRGRFKEFDARVNTHLVRRFGGRGRIEVHDWAASDCLTSAEWARSLENLMPGVRVTASDLTLYLTEASIAGGEAFVVDPEGRALQYIHPPFVIRMQPAEPWYLPVNRMMYQRARGRLARYESLWRPVPDWACPGAARECRRGGITLRPIPLVHPEAAAMAGCFQVRRHSAFDPLAEPVDVIRTMNIFNHSYFPEVQLRLGIVSAARSLRTGGVWIVGRTLNDERREHGATILRRDEHRFELIEDIGPGSEVRDLALQESW